MISQIDEVAKTRSVRPAVNQRSSGILLDNDPGLLIDLNVASCLYDVLIDLAESSRNFSNIPRGNWLLARSSATESVVI